MASTVGRYAAGRPARRKSCISFSGFNRSSGGSCSSRATSATTIRSARSSASTSSVWNTFLRVVLDRGSNTAQRRRPGNRTRNALSVSRIAVG